MHATDNMRSRIVKTALTIAAIVVTSSFLLMSPTDISATPKSEISSSVTQAGGSNADENKLKDELMPRIFSVALILVGTVCVGMIIFGGVKYATSAGDPSKATSAKNTLTYAIIGLIVAASAWAIVKYVMDKVF